MSRSLTGVNSSLARRPSLMVRESSFSKALRIG